MNESIRVANALDRGEIPWRFTAGFPRNVASQKPYGGVSPILLQIAADALSCTSPWWGTIPEWAALGSKVVPHRLGACIPGCNKALYNFDSIDQAAYEPPPLPEQDPDAVYQTIVKGLGVKLEHGADSTCKYFGADDRIRLPHKWMFEIGPGGIPGYWDSLGHEIYHATERRVRWNSNDDVAELRAEIGTGYLCAMLGIKPLARNLARHHDAHAERWAKAMRSDPQMLLKVCDNVTATVAYLLRFAGMDVSWHDATLEEPCPR